MTEAYSLFKFKYVDEWDAGVKYQTCELLGPIGDLAAGTQIDEILIAVFSDTMVYFDHGGKSYAFSLKAEPAGLEIKDKEEDEEEE